MESQHISWVSSTAQPDFYYISLRIVITLYLLVMHLINSFCASISTYIFHPHFAFGQRANCPVLPVTDVSVTIEIARKQLPPSRLHCSAATPTAYSSTNTGHRHASLRASISHYFTLNVFSAVTSKFSHCRSPCLECLHIARVHISQHNSPTYIYYVQRIV